MSKIDFKKQIVSKELEFRQLYVQKLQELLSNCKEQLFSRLSQKSRREIIFDTCTLSKTDGTIVQPTIESVANDFKRFVSMLSKRDFSNSLPGITAFCREFGIDRNVMASIPKDEREVYIQNCIHSQVQQAIYQLGEQSSKMEDRKFCKQNSRVLDWLKISSKFKHMEDRVKRTLIQVLNEDTNQKLLKNREPHCKVKVKVDLGEEYIDQKQCTQRWTDEDEVHLNNKIANLKNQFSDKNFLKRCQRFKFISSEEYQKIAYQEHSRSLNHQSNRQMSRDNILKKCLQKQVPLTQQEIKYILNTSPLMDRSINKALINQTVQSIDPEVLDKIEIKIADEIIGKFENSAKGIRKARKQWKASKMNSVLKDISNFQQDQIQRKSNKNIRQILKRKRTLIMNQIREAKSELNSAEGCIFDRVMQKVQFPTPLNRNHPPSAVFSIQSNDLADEKMNRYEKNYISKLKQRPMTALKPKRTPELRADFRMFYSGGTKYIRDSFNEQSNKNIKQALKSHLFLNILESNTDNQNCITLNKSSHVNKSARQTTENSRRPPPQTNKISNTNLHKSIQERMDRQRRRHVFIKILAAAAEKNFALLDNGKSLAFTREEINTSDKFGNTALYYAVKFRNYRAVQLLLQLGGDVNKRCLHSQTPLHVAFRSNDVKLIMECLNNEADLNTLDSNGLTPLGHASRDTLKTLGMLDGVASVEKVETGKHKFDNNRFVKRQENARDWADLPAEDQCLLL